MKKFDAVVIGAGIIGASCAYYLARDGLKVAVVDKKYPAAGASGACNGGLSYLGKKGKLLEMAYQSLKLYSKLERELNSSVGADLNKYIALVSDAEEDAHFLVESVNTCREYGLEDEVVSGKMLQEIVPGLSNRVEVAAIAKGGLQGAVNPFKVCHAYLLRFQEMGGKLFRYHDVKKILVEGGKVKGVMGENFTFSSPVVVNCAGYEAPSLWAELGVKLNLEVCKGTVLVTERYSQRIPANILSIDFFKPDRPKVALAVEQTADGNILIGSSAEPGVSNREIDYELLSRLARGAIEYFPDLKHLHVLRCFTGLRPVMNDGPYVGRINGIEGMYAAVGHGGSGVTLAPWSGRQIRNLVMGEKEGIL